MRRRRLIGAACWAAALAVGIWMAGPQNIAAGIDCSTQVCPVNGWWTALIVFGCVC